jgi:hypothetical protein
VVSKKAMAAKGKKALECREGISANKCKRVLCKITRKILLSLDQDVQTFSCCNLIRNMLFIQKDACKCQSSTKEIFSKGSAK